MSRRRDALLRVVVPLALVAAVLWYADVEQVRQRLAGVTLTGAAVVILLHTGDRLLMALKWRRLLVARGLPMGLGEAVRAYYVSSFAGVFLPMTVGADVVRVAALRKARVSAGDLVASITLERAIGAISQALWCALSLALIVALQLSVQVETTSLAVAVAGLLLVLGAAMPVSFRVARTLQRRWDDAAGLPGKLGALAGQYASWRDHPRELWLFLALTFLEGAFPILTYAAAARALAIDVSVVEMFAVIPIVYLIARLPLFPSAIGTEQGLFVAAGALLGLGADAAAAVSFLVSPIALLIALLPGAAAYLLSGSTGSSPE